MFGTNRVDLKAPTTTRTLKVNSGGIEVEGSQREAYLLYEHVCGLRIYWFDTLDTRQNEFALLIVPARRPAAEAAVLTAADRIKAIDQLETAGLLRPYEADAKRAAVTAERQP